MLKKLSRIFGIAGGALSLIESLFFAIVSAFAIYPESVPSDQALNYTTFSFITAILVVLGSIAALIASLNVREHSVIAGAVLIVTGALMLFYNVSVILPGAVWLYCIPPVLVIAAGAFALISAVKRGGSQTDEPGTEG